MFFPPKTINKRSIKIKKIMAIVNQGIMKLIRSITVWESKIINPAAVAITALIHADFAIAYVFCKSANTTAQTNTKGNTMSNDWMRLMSKMVAIVVLLFDIFENLLFYFFISFIFFVL